MIHFVWAIPFGLLCFAIGIGFNRDEREEKVMPEYEKEIKKLKEQVESLKGTLFRVVKADTLNFKDLKRQIQEME